jgi:hypothetical protein
MVTGGGQALMHSLPQHNLVENTSHAGQNARMVNATNGSLLSTPSAQYLLANGPGPLWYGYSRTLDILVKASGT